MFDGTIVLVASVVIASVCMTTLFPNDLPRLNLAQRAEIVLKWISNHSSVRVSDTSRIPDLCRRVVDAAGQIAQPGDPDYLALVQSFKDIQELWLIVHVLGEWLDQPPFEGPFRRAARNDPALPEEGDSNTPGRDAQFELFVAAIARRVGLAVSNDGSGQPDWQIAASTRRWTIEAKRAKSAMRVKRLIEKAASQISNSSIGGVVIVDVSGIDGADRRRLVHHLPEEGIHDARTRMGDAIRKQIPELTRSIENAPVGMVVIHDHLIRPAGKSNDGQEWPWALYGLWWAYYLESPGTQQYERYKEFWELFSQGFPNY